jgi:tryptophan synthase alpha chain
MAETSAVTGPDQIAAAFAVRGRRAALMPYLVGGFPTLEDSLEVARVYAEHADLVEVGVPFSDPLADGPAIQAAGQLALESGATLERVLDEVAAPLAESVPAVIMCYANPILARGFERVAGALRERGIAGLIVPDLPAAEAGELRAVCDAAGVALVALVAPTTPKDRLVTIAGSARGFVYVVSVTGVTGERAELPPELQEVVAAVRESAAVPAAVGFGIGTPAQAAAVAGFADGVIIGSRLVREVAAAPSLEAGIAGVDRFLTEASDALRLPSG